MNQLVQRLASVRLSMAGFVLLAACVLAGRWIALPIALLAVNLACAVALRPALRRGGLGVFHVALLALALLAGAGRLLHFDGRVEVAQGTAYDPAQVTVTAQGPWHGDGWRRLAFEQGPFTVGYAAGVKRARTSSHVWRADTRTETLVGDDTPLVIDGYRLYTTPNKGFAPLLAWQAEGGLPVQGVLHMPSYPLFEHQQAQRWTAPDGRELQLWLRIEQPLPVERAWTLDPQAMPAVLVVEAGGQRQELRPGDAMALPGATLRYERLLGWMGYRVFHDPTLLPMLAVAIAGVLGLAWHLWGRALRRLPLAQGAAA